MADIMLTHEELTNLIQDLNDESQKLFDELQDLSSKKWAVSFKNREDNILHTKFHDTNDLIELIEHKLAQIKQASKASNEYGN